jgi:hypothetical protein
MSTQDTHDHDPSTQGIIAADPNNPYNITGVAYESSLYAYRIFGCDGSVSDDSQSPEQTS